MQNKRTKHITLKISKTKIHSMVLKFFLIGLSHAGCNEEIEALLSSKNFVNENIKLSHII